MLIEWYFVCKKLAQFAVQCALPPRRSESPVCAPDNKPSCALHLLGWFIGSCGFSSLERRPEFWVLQDNCHFLQCPEKEMATHSSSLAWRIPWTEEPGGLQSTGSQRVGHDWATSLLLPMALALKLILFHPSSNEGTGLSLFIRLISDYQVIAIAGICLEVIQLHFPLEKTS